MYKHKRREEYLCNTIILIATRYHRFYKGFRFLQSLVHFPVSCNYFLTGHNFKNTEIILMNISTFFHRKDAKAQSFFVALLIRMKSLGFVFALGMWRAWLFCL